MTRRLPGSTGGCLGFALAVLLLAFGAAPAGATSGGCFLPDFVPEIFVEDWAGEVDTSSDPDICEDQCNDFRIGCKAAVKASHKCFVAFIEAAISGIVKSCEDIEDSEARKACKDEARGDRESILEDLDDSKIDGRDQCEELFLDCIDECAFE